MVEHDHTIGDVADDFHVVFDDDDREAPLAAQLPMSCGQLAGLLRVHAGGRLVEQHQAGLGGHGPSDLEPAAVGVREHERRLVEAIADEPGAEETEHLLGPCSRIACSSFREGLGLEERPEHALLGAAVLGDHHVLEDGQVGEQPDVLEGAGDARVW